MEQIILTIHRIFNFAEYKVQVSALFAAVFAVICSFSQRVLGISGFLFILLILVMYIDYKTGVRASKKEKKEITTKKRSRWIWKLGGYMLVLSLSLWIRLHILDNGLDYFDIPFRLIHFYIILHIIHLEMKSIDENLLRIGVKFQIFKVFDSLFGIMKNTITNKLKQ